MRHLPEGRLGGGRARVSHPRAQQGSCRVQRRRRRLPAPRCRSARRVIRSAVTFGDAAATAASARTKVQAQPTAADRATAGSAASAAVSAAATSGHANTVLKSTKEKRLGQSYARVRRSAHGTTLSRVNCSIREIPSNCMCTRARAAARWYFTW